jgi:antitoxin MazE
MLVSLIQIGNSRGIRIPKSILQQLKMEGMVELEVHNKEILLRPVHRKPRENWAEEFIKMHDKGDDQLLINDLNDQDEFQWEW